MGIFELTVFPNAFLDGSIGICVGTLAVTLTVFKLTNVNVATGIVEGALAV